jgi:glycosyltransferase involved in cell wall biosynthesis
MGSPTRTLFSVIIPTRNRSSSFAVTLASVLEQRCRDFEVVVVNDGSSEEHEPRYQELVEATNGVVRLLNLMHTDRGHGPGYSLNRGAADAYGEYLCFLDDDDQWTDPEHLGRAASVIARCRPKPDLIFANQQAYRDGTPVPEVIWIEDLKDRLPGPPDTSGSYTVTAAELLACPAHCHRNTTIVSRAFYLQLDGLDEEIRYEEDRDFYLRAIDRAALIKFLPFVVSRHNIPAMAKRASTSTSASELAKRLYQLRVFDKAILFGVRPELQHYAMRHRAYILKHIATEMARAGRFDCAAYYAREALMTQFTLRWFGVTVLLAVKKRLARIPRRR